MSSEISVRHRRRRLALLLSTSLCACSAIQLFAADPPASPIAPAGPPPPAAAPEPAPAVPDAGAVAPAPSDLPEPPSLFDLAAAGNPPAAAHRAAPSQNVTINLINRLVRRGALSKEDAEELIKQAEEDAVIAREQAAAALPPSITDDTVRVTYIPEVVKAQLRDSIKQEVMTQARNENWAAPRSIPDWTLRIRFSGDIRMRGEGDYFPDGSDNTGAFPNFNAINTGSPFDVTGIVFSPQYNVDQDRQRFRLRARLAAEADLGDGFTAGLRIGTGENNNPVSQNQSIGLANQGQGGNFSKYAVWLDRAFLKYQAGGPSGGEFAVSIGRFDNPFFKSGEMIWDDDIGFDGFAVQAKHQVFKGFTPFVTGGAFPVFNTDFNFASNRADKFKSTDKWLYAGQLGFDWKITKDLSAKFGAAYYYFDGIEGRLSDPFTPLTSSDAGNTDNTRPSFAQKGNTYMALRNIVPNASNNFGTTNQFQYFGLATEFREVALTAKIDYNHYEPFQVSLGGEFVKNTAFDRNAINAKAVNNRGPNLPMGAPGAFDGGDTGWIVNLKVGHPALEKRWDWNVNVGYRYVESDAVVDGFSDSDFGHGGTNMEGYNIGGSLALSPRVWLALRWLSADQIAGPAMKSDIFMFDLNGKF